MAHSTFVSPHVHTGRSFPGLHCSSKRLVYKLLLRPSEHPEQSPLGTAQERRRRAAGDSRNRPVIFARWRAVNRKGLHVVVSRVICGEAPISIVVLLKKRAQRVFTREGNGVDGSERFKWIGQRYEPSLELRARYELPESTAGLASSSARGLCWRGTNKQVARGRVEERWLYCRYVLCV